MKRQIFFRFFKPTAWILSWIVDINPHNRHNVKYKNAARFHSFYSSVIRLDSIDVHSHTVWLQFIFRIHINWMLIRNIQLKRTTINGSGMSVDDDEAKIWTEKNTWITIISKLCVVWYIYMYVVEKSSCFGNSIISTERDEVGSFWIFLCSWIATWKAIQNNILSNEFFIIPMPCLGIITSKLRSITKYSFYRLNVALTLDVE